MLLKWLNVIEFWITVIKNKDLVGQNVAVQGKFYKTPSVVSNSFKKKYFWLKLYCKIFSCAQRFELGQLEKQ